MSISSNNVILARPSVPSGYQFEQNPYIHPNMEPQDIIHVLDSGLTATYDKKVKVHFTLEWKEPNFFRGTQLEELRHIFNARVTEGLCIYPSPEYHPFCVYAVKWVSGFNFPLVRGNVYLGYEGTIELEGTQILTEVDEYFIMANRFPS